MKFLEQERFMTVLACLLFGLLFSGCYNMQVLRLPAYDQAMTMAGTAPQRPKLFYKDMVKINSKLTPYAIITATAQANAVDQETLIRSVWRKAIELKADIVLISSESVNSGATTTAMPTLFGATAVARPLYQTTIYGYCLRLNPSKIGIEVDETNMIVKFIDEGLRSTGLLEGDKVVEINGIDYTKGMPEFIRLKTGENVSISVVRPGTGKLTKIIKTIENPPTYLEYADTLLWKDLVAIDAEVK